MNDLIITAYSNAVARIHAGRTAAQRSERGSMSLEQVIIAVGLALFAAVVIGGIKIAIDRKMLGLGG